jgi:hypothetical protein
LLDEDGPEDLNGDGLIILDARPGPGGDYLLESGGLAIVAEADRSKANAGAWQLWVEGLDNDHDNCWNEDGVGGVNFNRNYPLLASSFFAPVRSSSNQRNGNARAQLTFVIAQPKHAAAFTFGAADNLLQNAPRGEAPKRPPVAMHEEDIAWYRELGQSLARGPWV